MEQDCTGSRESRDIFKVKRDVDSAVSPLPPAFSYLSADVLGSQQNTLKRIFTLNVANYPFLPQLKGSSNRSSTSTGHRGMCLLLALTSPLVGYFSF